MTEANARAAALECLLEVTEEGRFSHLVLNAAREKYEWMPEEEKNLLSRLVHGTLEYLYQIDRILDRVSTVRVQKMKPAIRGILRLSVYQLLYLDRIPVRAVIYEAVELTGRRGFRGLKGFVNAVLRHVAADREKIRGTVRTAGDLSIRYSCPPWIVKLLEEERGAESCAGILSRALKPSVFYVCPIPGAFPDLTAAGLTPSAYCRSVCAVPPEKGVSAARVIRQGGAYAQDLSSAIAVSYAAPAPGETVLDLCAAPGGKSIAAAFLLNGSGIVRSFDISERKAARIRENAERMNLSDLIRAEVSDAAQFHEELRESADLVIADLPCSGLGDLGRKPDLKLRLKREDIPGLVALQRTILQNAASYVKPGGRLLFSTCTMSRAENEENRAWFLAGHADFTAPDLTDRSRRFPDTFPVSCREAVEKRAGTETLRAGYLQILPQMFDSDGFFFALFEKCTDA